ncbi:MAG: hypothetical protein U9Q74_15750, partial [Gemmatimonadota bacterium]|nr:hypothetical protein [Gemmatimonadota bacterium]
EDGVVWADAHGFSTHGKVALAAELVALLERRGVADLRAGVADTPIAAQIAAMHGGRDGRPLTVVPPGTDRAYVALFPLDVLDPDPRLRPLFFGIGVSTCGELAALDRESIEVRLGPTAVPLWKLARADDPRLIFPPTPPDAPHASLDWVEYALKDPMRLLFVLNNLVDRVCATLASTGEGARELTVEFALTNRSAHVEVIRASRPTVNRRTWLRLIRGRVERMKLHAAVTGIALRASVVAEREAPQGDLFDRGLASRQATEDAVARLVEDQGDVVVAPRNTAHPLLDERTTWVPQAPANAAQATFAAEPARGEADAVVGRIEPPRRTVRLTTIPNAVRERAPGPRLHLQLAPVPAPIVVETGTRRDHAVPLRYRDDGGWHEIVNAAGPERVSGRTWDGDRSYAREYFRCVTREGVLVWIFRDAADRDAADGPGHASRRRRSRDGAGRWFLHGWWD